MYLKSVLDPSVVRLRLEVGSDNERTIKLYQKIEFDVLEYEQMYKDINI